MKQLPALSTAARSIFNYIGRSIDGDSGLFGMHSACKPICIHILNYIKCYAIWNVKSFIKSIDPDLKGKTIIIVIIKRKRSKTFISDDKRIDRIIKLSQSHFSRNRFPLQQIDIYIYIYPEQNHRSLKRDNKTLSHLKIVSP